MNNIEIRLISSTNHLCCRIAADMDISMFYRQLIIILGGKLDLLNKTWHISSLQQNNAHFRRQILILTMQHRSRISGLKGVIDFFMTLPEKESFLILFNTGISDKEAFRLKKLLYLAE